MFKKHTGVTPKQFKDESGQVTRGSYRPILRLRSSIAPRKLRRYIDIRDDNHYQHSEKGDLRMYRSKLPVGITLLLCLTLLVSACSRPANTNGSTGSTQSPTVGAESNISNTTNGSSEMVTYSAVNGEVQIPKNLKGS